MPKGENNRKLSDQDRDEIVRMYTTPNEDGTWTGVTTIARRFGVAHTAIQRWLKIAGVPMRTMKEAHRNMKLPFRYTGPRGKTIKTGKRCRPIKNVPTTPAPLCACGCGEPAKWRREKNAWGQYADGHRTPPQPFKNREWLFTEYITKNRSAPEIARACGVNKTTILHWLGKFDIPRRDVSESKRGRFGGHKNPAWRGGVTPVRQRLYKRDEWRKLVAETLKRDNYTCARCGVYRAKAEPKLVTHHIRAFATHPSLRFDPANLVTLCEKCHRWVHSKANKARRFIVD